jgi:16S rRNA (uracil1498-N3)-methyltransferase
MTRIYVDAELVAGSSCTLPESAAAHLVKVLRLASGAGFTLFDGRGGEYDAQLGTVAKTRVTALIGAQRASERESPLAVTLLPAVVRGERMDYIIQKATELGAQSIRPVLCARGNIRVDSDAGQRKLEHWRAVAISACEQCGRNTLPVIHAPLALRELLGAEGTSDATALRLVLLPEASLSLPQLLVGNAHASVTVLSGPEGGFDAAEETLALQAGFQACRLGPRVLRTETAPLAALAALQTLAGDFR